MTPYVKKPIQASSTPVNVYLNFLSARFSFYDNLLLMKKESDENLKKLKMEFNEKMKDQRDQGDTTHIDAEEKDTTQKDEEVTAPKDEEVTETKKEQEASHDKQYTEEQRTTFITEVNLTYKSDHKSRSKRCVEKSDETAGRIPTKRNNAANVRALEKELQETKKELRTLRKKYELARTSKKHGKGQGKQTNDEDTLEKKKVDEIKELLVKIEVMKEKEQQMVEQMNIMKEALKEHEAKYNDKCQEVEDLVKCQEQQTPDKIVQTLKDKLKRLKISEEELQEEIDQCKRKLKGKAEEVEKLRNQLRMTRNERDTQKINYEDSKVLLKGFQDEVRRLEENKKATNERMRQMGGQVRISKSTQTHPATVSVATNTENSIYNVCGRSLKQEDLLEDRFLMSLDHRKYLYHYQKKGLQTQVKKSMLQGARNFHGHDVQSLSDFDFDADKVMIPDGDEYRKNIKAMEEILEVYQPDSTASNQEGVDRAVSDEEENLTERENEEQIKFPQISVSDDQNPIRKEKKDVKLNIDVKLPNISGSGNFDGGLPEGERENAEEQQGDTKRSKSRKEQTPVKVAAVMKEGGETEWKPITDNQHRTISPQKCPSSPVFKNQAAASFGKTKSDLIGVIKDNKLRASTKMKNEKNKKEFMLIPSDQCEGNKRN